MYAAKVKINMHNIIRDIIKVKLKYMLYIAVHVLSDTC